MGGRGRQISEFEASLIYRVSSRTTRTIQRNPVWKKREGRENRNGCGVRKERTRSQENVLKSAAGGSKREGYL